jgi:hypothetical protein
MALTQIQQAMLQDGILTADAAGRLKMADAFVNNAKILDGTIDRAKLLQSYPLEVVASASLSGLSSYAFAINAYPSYMVFFDCISGTTTGAHFQMKMSYDGGSTYPALWNYREVLFGVDGTTSNNNVSTGNGSQAWLYTNTWDGAGTPGTAGSGGVIKIQGCGAYLGVNKRTTFEGIMGGQSPSGQEARICMGQLQDDAHQYNYAQVSLSSGTFKAQARILVCGIRAV